MMAAVTIRSLLIVSPATQAGNIKAYLSQREKMVRSTLRHSSKVDAPSRKLNLRLASFEIPQRKLVATIPTGGRPESVRRRPRCVSVQPQGCPGSFLLGPIDIAWCPFTRRALAEVGCSALEIMSITGHTDIREIERYCREAARKLAVAAMTKLEGGFDIRTPRTS